jgi:hypothetical protein
MKIGKPGLRTRTVAREANLYSSPSGINVSDTTATDVNRILSAIRALGTACLEISTVLEEERRMICATTRMQDRHPKGASINPRDFIDDEDDGSTAA